MKFKKIMEIIDFQEKKEVKVVFKYEVHPNIVDIVSGGLNKNARVDQDYPLGGYDILVEEKFDKFFKDEVYTHEIKFHNCVSSIIDREYDRDNDVIIVEMMLNKRLREK